MDGTEQLPLSKNAICKLALKGGVSSMTDDCFEQVRLKVIEDFVNLVRQATVITKNNGLKTVQVAHVNSALKLTGRRLTLSPIIVNPL
jgi:histone H3/H4